jgi:DnaJ domain
MDRDDGLPYPFRTRPRELLEVGDVGKNGVSPRRSDDGSDEAIDSPRNDGDVAIDIDDVPLTSARAEQYQDWVERMHRKRESNQQRILGSHDEGKNDASYWRAEDVFLESERLASGGLSHRDTPRTDEMLAVLGLSGDPSTRDVELAFRRLALEHHPDRHVEADESTRAHHLDQMRRINEAYAALRRLQSD